MATPIVHASLGVMAVSLPYLVGSKSMRRVWPTLFAAAFLACLPDLDLLVSYVATGDVRTYHFGVSHSYAFALVCTLAASPWLTQRQILWMFGLIASHVLVDSLTGPMLGWHKAVTIYPWWPVSGQPLNAPLTLFHGVQHGNWFSAANFRVVVFDLLVFALPCALAMFILLKRQNRETFGS